MRLFVALVPPAPAREHLEAFLEPRRDAAAFRWAAPDQLHVTLAFLAAVEERRLDDLVDGLERAAARRTPFGARVAGGGAFPDAARARVLWAGLVLDAAAATELDRLAVGSRTAAGRAGIEVDGRRFRPHLTLGRLAVPQDVTRWVRLLEAYDGPAWSADAVALVQSHLGDGPGGRPRYEVLAELLLGVGAGGAVGDAPSIESSMDS